MLFFLCFLFVFKYKCIDSKSLEVGFGICNLRDNSNFHNHAGLRITNPGRKELIFYHKYLEFGTRPLLCWVWHSHGESNSNNSSSLIFSLVWIPVLVIHLMLSPHVDLCFAFCLLFFLLINFPISRYQYGSMATAGCR